MSEAQEQKTEKVLEKMSVGEVVAKARRARRLTLKKIAHELNIRETHLEALEGNRFSDLPGKVYISGFLRSYCDYLEVDANPLIQQLRDEGVLKPDAEYALPTPVEEGVMPSKKVLMTASALLVLCLAGYGVYSLKTGDFMPTFSLKLPGKPSPMMTDEVIAQVRQEVDEKAVQPAAEFLAPVIETVEKVEAEIAPQTEVKETVTEAVAVQPAAEPEVVADVVPEVTPEPAKPAVTDVQAIMARADGITPALKAAPAVAEEPSKTEEPVAETVAPDVVQAEIPPAPKGARIRLVAKDEVWVQVRDANSEKVYVSKVLKKGESHWVRPRVDAVLDVGNPPALDIVVDGNNLGVSGILNRRVWGLTLTPSYLLADYYGKGLNKQPNVETKSSEEAEGTADSAAAESSAEEEIPVAPTPVESAPSSDAKIETKIGKKLPWVQP